MQSLMWKDFDMYLARARGDVMGQLGVQDSVASRRGPMCTLR